MKLHIETPFAAVSWMEHDIPDHTGTLHKQNLLVVEKKNCVAVLIEAKETGEFLFVSQFRPGSYLNSKVAQILEIPAGHVELSQDLYRSAQAEVLEETGLKVEIADLCCLGGGYTSPGILTEYITVFYTKVSKKDTMERIVSRLKENEYITLTWLPLRQALETVKDFKFLAALGLLSHTQTRKD
jgi:nudix-type nucleoside diphosphatase (YffH/AdpP family)